MKGGSDELSNIEDFIDYDPSVLVQIENAGEPQLAASKESSKKGNQAQALNGKFAQTDDMLVKIGQVEYNNQERIIAAVAAQRIKLLQLSADITIP